MEILIILALLLWGFVFLWPRIRVWLVRWFIGTLTNRMQEQARQQAQGRQRAGEQDRQRRGAKPPTQKQDLREVEARKFAHKDNADYVDFEELP